jgi:hypothetical protein
MDKQIDNTNADTKLTYLTPTVTVLGSAEKLTKGGEAGSDLDCSRPGIGGVDATCGS